MCREGNGRGISPSAMPLADLADLVPTPSQASVFSVSASKMMLARTTAFFRCPAACSEPSPHVSSYKRSAQHEVASRRLLRQQSVSRPMASPRPGSGRVVAPQRRGRRRVVNLEGDRWQ
jgi:hypothetical protein